MRRMLLSLLCPLVLLGILLSADARVQDDQDSERALVLIRDVIKARGGEAYLKVRTWITEGQYTRFEKGVSGDPQPFVDYIVYPDRERTEFGKGKEKYIQANIASTGWIYDATQKQIRDQNEEQIKTFQQGMRHDLDNVLRRSWQEPGAKLVYLGRREAWKNIFSEAVRIDFPDGEAITIHFDPRTKLPMMSEFKTVTAGHTANEQVRYFRWAEFKGVQFPTLQDFYRDNQQSGRVSFDSVRFNEDVPERLFDRPSDIKKVK